MEITILAIHNTANEEQEGKFEEKQLLGNNVRISDNFYSADGSHKLILRPKAVREIFDFIEWDVGARPDLRVEQGGILLGTRYFDSARGIHFAVVYKAVAAEQARGSSGFLEISHECWNTMYEKKDEYVRESGRDVVIVGWFHTHPNRLPCFMSGTDRNTQRLFFDGDHTYSIVLNPQRHLWKAFRAKECYPVQAFLSLEHSEDMEESKCTG